MVTGGILAVCIAFFLYLKKNANVLQNMAQFSIVGFKIKTPTFFKTPFRLSVLIKNPSNIKIDIKNYIVEVYRLKDGVKKLLAASNPTSLAIPSNGNIVSEIEFEASNFNLIDLIIGTLKEGSEMQLKGKISFTIKADVAGQYLEKEFLY